MKIKLVVIGGVHAGKEIPVRRARFVIGRSTECQLRLNGNLISRRHCVILLKDERIVVEDLGSTDGTFVNGRKISVIEPQELNHGDHLAVGPMEFEVHISGAIGSRQPEVSTTEKTIADTQSSTPTQDSDAQPQRKGESTSASAAAGVLETMNRFVGRKK
jgi:pSer/pThr/pTyr-binding forkhead associated (FHA) protein